MTQGKSIDKIVKLLDLLDKHIHEQNCGHSPDDLLKEYETLMRLKKQRRQMMITQPS